MDAAQVTHARELCGCDGCVPPRSDADLPTPRLACRFRAILDTMAKEHHYAEHVRKLQVSDREHEWWATYNHALGALLPSNQGRVEWFHEQAAKYADHAHGKRVS